MRKLFNIQINFINKNTIKNRRFIRGTVDSTIIYFKKLGGKKFKKQWEWTNLLIDNPTKHLKKQLRFHIITFNALKNNLKHSFIFIPSFTDSITFLLIQNFLIFTSWLNLWKCFKKVTKEVSLVILFYFLKCKVKTCY